MTIEVHDRKCPTKLMSSSKPVAVVVSYNSRSDLQRLCPLLAQEEGVRPLVVDNGSVDGSQDVVRSVLGENSLIETGENLGYGAAINRALATEPPGPVLILNPDLDFEPGTLTAMLAGLESSGAGILVGHNVDENGRLAYSLRREPTPLRALGEAVLGGERSGRHSCLGEMVMDRERYLEPADVDWATGAAMAVGEQCRSAVGPWNEHFFLYSEETEYMARARDGGFAVRYDPSVEIVHIGGDMLVSAGLYALGARNRVEYVRRRHGRFAGLRMAVALSIGELLRLRRNRPLHGQALRAIWSPQPEAVAMARGTA